MSPESNINEGNDRPREAINPWVTRVYIVDDHPFFTFALTSLINSEADLTVCGSGIEQGSVLSAVARLEPDLLLIDVNLMQQDGLTMAAALRQVSRGVPILFLSSLQNPQFEIDSRWLEPCSFVEKTKDPVDIITAIRQTLTKFRVFHNQLPSNH